MFHSEAYLIYNDSCREICYLFKNCKSVLLQSRTCLNDIHYNLRKTNYRSKFNRTVQLDYLNSLILLILKVVLSYVRILCSYSYYLILLEKLSCRFGTAISHTTFTETEIHYFIKISSFFKQSISSDNSDISHTIFYICRYIAWL